MKIVAIIPARGGSKRIHQKNIRLFAGKPIIAYSIAAAKKTGLFDRIIVSTDSEEIAYIARKENAEIPFMRPADISDEYTVTGEVIFHALKWLEESGDPVDYVCCIYATAPFIKPEYIIQGYNEMKKMAAASAFSVTTFPYTIFRALKINEKGRLEMIWPENHSRRSQDLPDAYHDAGQFYWADARKFVKGKKFLTRDTLPIVIPRYLVQDIDTNEDWETAERMFIALQRRTEQKSDPC